MLKTKPIIIGTITAAAVFIVLLMGEALIADKMEKMNEVVVSNFAYVFLLLSVFTGAFASALAARGRGVIYGLVIACICGVISIAIGLIMGGNDIGLMIARSIGCLPAGVIGGICGILVSNKNEYI